MAALFLVFVAFIAAAIALIARRRLPHRLALVVQAGLPLWLLYVGAMSYFGAIGNTSLRPPGIVFVIVPVVLFVFFGVLRSAGGRTVALGLPLWVLLALQTYRVVVELFLHRLWLAGVVPQMLTFEGANVDIYIGATAPLIAWLSRRGKTGLRVALFWNVLGLAALANVIVRAALTAPGPLNVLHAEPPNMAIATFPYTYVAGFLAPLAVTLHVLVLRAIRDRLKASGPHRPVVVSPTTTMSETSP